MRSIKPRADHAIALTAAFACMGCLYRGGGESVEPADLDDDVALVDGVPIVEQETTTDCGAAALASVLNYWGLESSPRHIRQQTGGNAIRAGALRDHARSRGMDAFVIRGTFEDLRVEVQANRPVLVGMNKPYVGNQWLAHYEVVTGIGPSKVLTMDPADGWRSYSKAAFEREWQAAGHVTLIVAPH